jgi:hypothetical protein
MARQDIILNDSNDDLQIVNGDFVIAESNNQHAAIIFDAMKGEIRENPSLGFGAKHYLKSNLKEVELKRALRVELQRDGYVNVNIGLDNKTGILTIDVE